MTKVLVGSAVRQRPAILKAFLTSLINLDKSGLIVDYVFVNDNDVVESENILTKFSVPKGKVTIFNGERYGTYYCDSNTHRWMDGLIWKVAEYKDKIISYAREKGYAYLFLIDSDIVLHPQTLLHLINCKKDIISEIFWTKWQPDLPSLPQVWVSDKYTLYYKQKSESLTKEEIKSRTVGFLHCLKIPGVYEVGGLGACTLLSKKALRAKVGFKEIPNLSFWGEDRHFCIRAAALGFKLYVDTCYPAYHIYREEDLAGVESFLDESRRNPVVYQKDSFLRTNTKAQNNKLTLSMLVRNEAQRYLKEVLENALQYIDEAVILDDASDDNTVEVCKEVLKEIPLTIISNDQQKYPDELSLRKQLWDLTLSTGPDWILTLDADEVFEDLAKEEMKKLINQPYYDYYAFRLYDMWDENHYREDKYWQAHFHYRPFLLRYQPNFQYIWRKTPIHCRFPVNIHHLPGAISRLRLKHLGWADPKYRAEKYHRYMKYDPQGKYGVMEQYQSILDPNPRLIRWEE
ncbi:glycosyltransferase family 2 protein [Desulfofalx alkaliphila]|uniref:glycosyltransferase family 2 protein n=1 Tax=Desulfofalx alkaliphila TaxID=105483 RepID=UPI0004E1EDF0|nr:glycosyltransferase [Desulfofalx alkaliphila]